MCGECDHEILPALGEETSLVFVFVDGPVKHRPLLNFVKDFEGFLGIIFRPVFSQLHDVCLVAWYPNAEAENLSPDRCGPHHVHAVKDSRFGSSEPACRGCLVVLEPPFDDLVERSNTWDRFAPRKGVVIRVRQQSDFAISLSANEMSPRSATCDPVAFILLRRLLARHLLEAVPTCLIVREWKPTSFSKIGLPLIIFCRVHRLIVPLDF